METVLPESLWPARSKALTREENVKWLGPFGLPRRRRGIRSRTSDDDRAGLDGISA
jgi:hypothetical protein